MSTSTYPNTIKYEGICKDLKGFVFYCSEVSNMDGYSKFIKEVAEYIGRKFSYGADIQRSLENEMNTIFPSPSSPNGTRYHE